MKRHNGFETVPRGLHWVPAHDPLEDGYWVIAPVYWAWWVWIRVKLRYYLIRLIWKSRIKPALRDCIKPRPNEEMVE